MVHTIYTVSLEKSHSNIISKQKKSIAKFTSSFNNMYHKALYVRKNVNLNTTVANRSDSNKKFKNISYEKPM